ncbi:unnamed protein product [Effrenium voratum]|uniref:GST N-terminal domain-containing protein n=1 Tax=Effrenium voratum TaxID=2562239 RepID=A0AA36I102_9DINO|nr:unnamed protein product [Effrenium voratum]
MLLFGRPTSSNTQKVLWTLCEIPSRPSFELVLASARLGADSNLLCDSTGAKPYGVVDTEEYRRLNPTRLVPCLVDGSLAVWESHSIVRYLAQKYAPELHLGTVEGMARCSPWMDWLLFSQFHECNHHFIDQTARTLPADRDVGLMARSYEGYVEKLQKVEEQIGETDAYVTGRDFSIADIVIGAELCRFSCGMTRWAREPRGFPTLVQLPNLERYFRRLQDRPAFHTGCLQHERQHQLLEPLAEGEYQLLLPKDTAA